MFGMRRRQIELLELLPNPAGAMFEPAELFRQLQCYRPPYSSSSTRRPSLTVMKRPGR